jgi:thiamine transporter
MNNTKLDSRALTEIATSVALAYVLNLIKIYQLPQGGSITLGSMVPILLLALRRGPYIGVLAGTVFGFVQLALGGFFFSVPQAILDYPIAYGVLGVAGYFKRQHIIGVVVSVALRFIAHFASGVLFFGQFAPPELGPYLYSVIYNGSYLLPEMIISSILVYLLIKRGVLDIAI